MLRETSDGPLDSKMISQPWIFPGRTDAEAPILWPPDEKSRLTWKRHLRWERLKAGREGGDRGWDGWMATLTQWTWVSANSGSFWRTGRPGVLHSMGSQSRALLSNWITTMFIKLLANNPRKVFLRPRHSQGNCTKLQRPDSPRTP